MCGMADSEILPWLKGIPLAPEYRPTEAEFADPITFILRIEEEASQYGICKIVPPTPRPQRKWVISNLNRCIGAAVQQGKQPEDCTRAKFPTRKQQLGWEDEDLAHYLEWKKGPSSTLEQFENRAKGFARDELGTAKDVTPLVVDSIFWSSADDGNPTTIESSDEISGSLFPENASEEPDSKRKKSKAKEKEMNSGWKLASSPWNMRYLSKLQGSLLRYMPNEIQGVTSPLLHIATLFTWSAWHTEDHELHSLNYLHFGASKSWYAVPPGAAAAFEDVIRVQGYGEELDPEATIAMLGEKTTLISPEVLVSNGVPCCRLVQNPGEYVVTFPRSYNLGFSHGFNCAERIDFATPGWLKVAKEAAVRRIVMDRLPMFCHEQLLYQSALAFSTSSSASEIRSSRLKNKKLCVEDAVKSEFVNDVMKNRHVLEKLITTGQSRCVLLKSATTKSRTKKGDAGKENFDSAVNFQTVDSISLLSFVCESMEASDDKVEDNRHSSGISWGALSCGVCGILCYSCIAVVQPSPGASKNISRGNIPCTEENIRESEPVKPALKPCVKRRRKPAKKSSPAEEEYSLPPCILCPEHALQVSLLLQAGGGSRVLIVLHPEYETFEKNAEQFAKEMKMDFVLKEIVYDKTNGDDLRFIGAAMDGGISPKADNNWARRLHMESPAPVVKPEMKASEEDDEDELLVEKRLKEKKCWVVGRWCGRVWRYDQAHVLLGGSRTAKKDEFEGSGASSRDFDGIVTQVLVEDESEEIPDEDRDQTDKKRGKTGKKKQKDEFEETPERGKAGKRKQKDDGTSAIEKNGNDKQKDRTGKKQNKQDVLELLEEEDKDRTKRQRDRNVKRKQKNDVLELWEEENKEKTEKRRDRSGKTKQKDDVLDLSEEEKKIDKRRDGSGKRKQKDDMVELSEEEEEDTSEKRRDRSGKTKQKDDILELSEEEEEDKINKRRDRSGKRKQKDDVVELSEEEEEIENWRVRSGERQHSDEVVELFEEEAEDKNEGKSGKRKRSSEEDVTCSNKKKNELQVTPEPYKPKDRAAKRKHSVLGIEEEKKDEVEWFPEKDRRRERAKRKTRALEDDNLSNKKCKLNKEDMNLNTKSIMDTAEEAPKPQANEYVSVRKHSRKSTRTQADAVWRVESEHIAGPFYQDVFHFKEAPEEFWASRPVIRNMMITTPKPAFRDTIAAPKPTLTAPKPTIEPRVQPPVQSFKQPADVQQQMTNIQAPEPTKKELTAGPVQAPKPTMRELTKALELTTRELRAAWLQAQEPITTEFRATRVQAPESVPKELTAACAKVSEPTTKELKAAQESTAEETVCMQAPESIIKESSAPCVQAPEPTELTAASVQTPNLGTKELSVQEHELCEEQLPALENGKSSLQQCDSLKGSSKVEQSPTSSKVGPQSKSNWSQPVPCKNQKVGWESPENKAYLQKEEEIQPQPDEFGVALPIRNHKDKEVVHHTTGSSSILEAQGCETKNCCSDGIWHDVYISFSENLRSSCIDRYKSERIKHIQEASEQNEQHNVGWNHSEEQIAAELGSEHEDVKLGATQSDEPTSSVQDLFESADDTMDNDDDDESYHIEDDTVVQHTCMQTRSRRAKEESLKAKERHKATPKKFTVKKKPRSSARRSRGTDRKASYILPEPELKSKLEAELVPQLEPELESEMEFEQEVLPGKVHACDFEGCIMSFHSLSELTLHKRNICTKCGKRLCSHSYLMHHYKVHMDDRPLQCPWKGCKKTFKWSWARTEHLRVHTGERPYTCNGCKKSYRSVIVLRNVYILSYIYMWKN